MNASGYAASPVPLAFSDTGGERSLLVSLQSVNFPGLYLRHRNFAGELTPITSALDRHDATFHVVPALAGSTGRPPTPLRGLTGLGNRASEAVHAISFEATNYPGYYLRALNGRLMLQKVPSGDVQFQRDASFVVVPGLGDTTSCSFRLLGAPDQYLRHRDFHIYVEANATPGRGPFDQDGSFRIGPPLG